MCVSVCVSLRESERECESVCVRPINLNNEVVLRPDLGRNTTNNSAHKFSVSPLSLLKKNNNTLKIDRRLPSRI